MVSRRSLTAEEISLLFNDNEGISNIGEFDHETECLDCSKLGSEHNAVWALDQRAYRYRASRPADTPEQAVCSFRSG